MRGARPSIGMGVDGVRGVSPRAAAKDGGHHSCRVTASSEASQTPRHLRRRGSCRAPRPCGNALWTPSARYVRVVREVYAGRFGEAAARRIEEALPERERETLARALRARPAGIGPAQHRRLPLPRSAAAPALRDGCLAGCSSPFGRGSRTESSGFNLPSAKSRLFATKSLTSARSIATVFFARASHAATCWRCCKVRPSSACELP